MDTLSLPATLADLRVLPLQAADIPTLQAFYAANPLYFEATGGESAQPGDAEADFHARPPPDMTYRQRWLLALCDEHGQWQAVVEVVAGLQLQQAWHIALFMVDARHHGQGLAVQLYNALEAWTLASGAYWLRLGVVVGHTRAERFWLRQGFVEVTQRHAVQMGRRCNSLRVMVKPLRSSVGAYLQQVPRDRPQA